MDEKLLVSKIKDKINRTLRADYQSHTDFLNLNEQSIFLNNINNLPKVNYFLFGGNDICERKIIVFYPNFQNIEDVYIPIKVLQISLTNKTITNNITHRDYLGAILNLGIERHTIGDIFISEKEVFVFCIDTIGDYIVDKLVKVKNYEVKVKEVDLNTVSNLSYDFDKVVGTVSTVRLDSVIKLGFSLSRTNALALIQNKKAYINSKLVEKPSVRVEEGQTISLRGFGKIKLNSIGETSRKGRVFIEILRYK